MSPNYSEMYARISLQLASTQLETPFWRVLPPDTPCWWVKTQTPESYHLSIEMERATEE